MNIEIVTRANFDQVLSLIADYQRFYSAARDEARNRAPFSQFLDDHSRGVLFVALQVENTLGFDGCISRFRRFMPALFA